MEQKIMGGKMKKIVEIVHDILAMHITSDSIAADFTMGQGYDTEFLAKLAQYVYAFDIQESAYEQTMMRLEKAELLDKVNLILHSHAECDEYIKEKIDAGVFNFGFLPHGDETITTNIESSLKAVQKALSLLKRYGILVLVMYPGHVAGKIESDALYDWSQTLNSKYFSVCCIQMHNKRKSPYIIVIQKEKEMNDDKSSCI